MILDSKNRKLESMFPKTQNWNPENYEKIFLMLFFEIYMKNRSSSWIFGEKAVLLDSEVKNNASSHFHEIMDFFDAMSSRKVGDKGSLTRGFRKSHIVFFSIIFWITIFYL